ncbi:MAG: hypothetical protein AABY44_05610 [Nitrospirota bacterium]
MNDDETRHRARLKEGLYKKFLEELMLLSIYSDWKYSENNVLCQLVIDKQEYDAIITNLPADSHEYQEYIEITSPIDGRKENEISKIVNEKGFHGEVFDYDTSAQRKEATERIIKKVYEKAVKDYQYPNSALLIGLNLFPFFDLKRDDHRADITNLVQKLRQISYKVRSVYLILLNAQNLPAQERILAIIGGST